MAFTSLTGPSTVTPANRAETSLGDGDKRFKSLAHLQHLNRINDLLRGVERKILYDTINHHFDRRTCITYTRRDGEIVEAEIETQVLTGEPISRDPGNMGSNIRAARFPINSRDTMHGAIGRRSSMNDSDRYDSLGEHHWNIPVRGHELVTLIDMLRHYAELWAEQRGKKNDSIILKFVPGIGSDLTPKEAMLYDMACSLIGMDQLL